MHDELLRLERAFWFGDAGFYRERLTEGCRMAFPGLGLLDRDAAIAGIESGPRWDAVELSDARVLPVGEGAAVVSYRARALRGGEAYEAVVGSVYVRQGGPWLLAYHQHTPAPAG